MPTIIIVILFSLTLNSFGQNLKPPVSNRHALSGQWKFVQYKDLANNKVLKEPSNLRRPVIVKFEDDGFQGHIEGQTVKNSIHGEYYVRKDNGIYFPSVGVETNDREEKEWGDDLPKIFLDVTLYSFQKDTLIMKYDGGSKAMIFIPNHEQLKIGNQIYK